MRFSTQTVWDPALPPPLRLQSGRSKQSNLQGILSYQLQSRCPTEAVLLLMKMSLLTMFGSKVCSRVLPVNFEEALCLWFSGIDWFRAREQPWSLGITSFQLLASFEPLERSKEWHWSVAERSGVKVLDEVCGRCGPRSLYCVKHRCSSSCSTWRSFESDYRCNVFGTFQSFCASKQRDVQTVRMEVSPRTSGRSQSKAW